MTVTEIINIAIVSQYRWAVSILKSGLFGGGTPDYLPQLLLSVRKNVEWKLDQEGATDGTSATSTITVDSLGGLGAEYLFQFPDPDLGTITLGAYTETVADTDTTILAASIKAALNLNSYGYSFTSSANVVTCRVPQRIYATANGLTITCTITTLSIVLTTEVTPNVSAAPSSGDSVMYILKVINNTLSTQILTNIASYVRGTHSTNDFFSIDAYSNAIASLSGASYLASVAPIDSNSVVYDIGVSLGITASTTVYLILVLSVNATPTSGRTGFIDGSIDPVVLTITGSPTQINNQSNLSGVVTIV